MLAKSRVKSQWNKTPWDTFLPASRGWECLRGMEEVWAVQRSEQNWAGVGTGLGSPTQPVLQCTGTTHHPLLAWVPAKKLFLGSALLKSLDAETMRGNAEKLHDKSTLKRTPSWKWSKNIQCIRCSLPKTKYNTKDVLILRRKILTV